jgi:predicted amidohydrolase YtcJ
MIKQLLAGAAALAIAGAANAATYAIQAGHVVVDAAQAERGASTIIVENGRIARIDNGFTAPEGAIVVDERSRTVMPGMTDVHVHLTDTSGEPWYQGFTIKHSVPYAATVGLTHAREMIELEAVGIGEQRLEIGRGIAAAALEADQMLVALPVRQLH